MIAKFDEPRTISVTDFKAHCTEELRAVEEKGIRLVITRHGKTIAVVEPPTQYPLRTLGELMGSAASLIEISKGAGLDTQTWSNEDWVMHVDEESP
ncbi:MAG TPA: type II toxin-antitoxin system Phd/YefM family antitoxin [Verrucomicrobiales bacterium]|jgi:prevent-host-death family protein|nr:type II toxin-antitoxin system Phd/YefM family antitoxin [Verrucomicrobiales bacterium]